jgi:hypothetical protein
MSGLPDAVREHAERMNAVVRIEREGATWRLYLDPGGHRVQIGCSRSLRTIERQRDHVVMVLDALSASAERSGIAYALATKGGGR